MTQRTECYNDGRTPGYWKNHTERWDDGFGAVCPLGHTVQLAPGTTFEAAFGLPDLTFVEPGRKGAAHADLTLEEALGLNGGGQNALARAATAALLNAVPGDEFHSVLWQEEIICAVQKVYAGGYDPVLGGRLAGILDYFNNLQGATFDPLQNNPHDPFGLLDLVHDANWLATVQDQIL